tara:strand:+ start:340 stop:1107 length:768 start_codon:yes stop_codon:yes gene_type:complete
MDYDSKTLLELKKLCKERGLKISGTKDEVVIRLMENDESKQSEPVQVLNQVPAQNYSTQQFPLGIQPHFYYQKQNELFKTLGTFVLLYGIFRMGWAILFTFDAGMGLGWLTAPLGVLMGFGFVFGGVLIYNEYRNGIYFTLVVLTISGVLSLVFHGPDPNSVSIAWGDEMLMTSVLCSTTCIGIAAIPLVFSTDNLKKGWPEAIDNLINNLYSKNNNSVSEKIRIECSNCDKVLLVPIDYSGNIKCPSCDNSMSI